MQNHFDVGYEFTTETGEKRYIAFVDYDYGIPHYDTYPVTERHNIDRTPELLFDSQYTDEFRICMEEHQLYELRIKELEKQIKSDKISVETPLGTLEATVGGDPGSYPEIFTYIRRPDGVEIDLVAVEIKLEDNFVRGYLYGDTTTDQYTRTHDWSQGDIDVEVE